MKPRIANFVIGMSALAGSMLSFPALAIEIDSNEKVLQLLQNRDFRDEFLRIAQQTAQSALYIAVDETGIAMGSGQNPSGGPIPSWVHVEARQICRQDRRNRKIQSGCQLLIENDRFVHPGISLVPSNLASTLRDPGKEKDVNQKHWQAPETALIIFKEKSAEGQAEKKTMSKQAILKNTDENGPQNHVPEAGEPVTLVVELAPLTPPQEEKLSGVENPRLLYTESTRDDAVAAAPAELRYCDEMTDNESKRCLVRKKADPQLARLEAIEPVTRLSEKQKQDLRALRRDQRFNKYLRKYEQAPEGKALALAIDGERVATGLIIAKRTSPDRLKSIVLDQCRKNRIRKKIESGCFIYRLNDHKFHPDTGAS